MNNKNFNSFKNLKAPNSWIENAIKIPSTQKAVTPIFFIRHSKIIASVACFVIVCAASLMFVFNSDDNLIPVTPTDAPIATSPTESTDTQVNADVTEPATNGDNKAYTHTNDENGDAPFEGTVNDSESKPSSPSHNETPSETSNESSVTEPTEIPVIKPTNLPTVKPTRPPTVKPSVRPPDEDKPNNPQAPGSPDDPYEPPTDGEGDGEAPTIPTPTIKPDYAAISEFKSTHDEYEVVDHIETKWLTGSKKVYCQVKNVDKPYSPWLNGDELFSPDHLCTVWKEKNGYTYFAYSISNNYKIEENGTYLYVIYNENGQAFSTNRTYVYANK